MGRIKSPNTSTLVHIEEQITSKQTVDNSGEIFTGYHHQITRCLPQHVL